MSSPDRKLTVIQIFLGVLNLGISATAVWVVMHLPSTEASHALPNGEFQVVNQGISVGFIMALLASIGVIGVSVFLAIAIFLMGDFRPEPVLLITGMLLAASIVVPGWIMFSSSDEGPSHSMSNFHAWTQERYGVDLPDQKGLEPLVTGLNEDDLYINSQEIIVHSQDGLITLRKPTGSSELPQK